MKNILILQYFCYEKSFLVNLLEVKFLQDKTLEAIANFWRDSYLELMRKIILFMVKINKYKFLWILVERYNWCSKLKQGTSDSPEGVGCPTCILCHASPIASDILSIAIKAIVMKYYSYFIYNVWTRQLYLIFCWYSIFLNSLAFKTFCWLINKCCWENSQFIWSTEIML